MRIPSQLNDESLYGRRGSRRPQQFDSYRRLIRLSVALLLVLAVIGQAKKPEIYETFFPAAGDELAAEGKLVKQGENAGIESTNLGFRVPQPVNLIEKDSISPVIFQSARAITESLSINEQRQWVVVLSRWQKGENFRVMEPVIDVSVDLVQQLEGLDDDERLAWQSMLRKFGTEFASPDTIPPDSGLVSPPKLDVVKTHDADSVDEAGKETESAESHGSPLDEGDKQRLNAWLATLDQAAVDRVIDGAVWRSQDIDAFYRQLDQCQYLTTSGAMSVAVVPLMQQPRTYLGAKVRVAGRVARSEKKAAAANPFGITEYWELWVRPSSGGDRPFVFIVPDAPDAAKTIGTKEVANKGPEVRVVGRFFKRLAYASPYGADAAPVIVGRVMGLRSGSSATSSVPFDVSKAPSARTLNQFWGTLILASVIGLAIALIVTWRTTVAARRSREIRVSHRAAPDAFLDELANQPADSTSP